MFTPTRYLALLYASKLRKPGTKQKIQDKAQFDPEAIQNHIRIIHSDKHHDHTRWFNSFLGRIFLGVYKTKKIEEIFIHKITRKTLKLKRPSFLGEIKVRSFQVGHSIPYITRTKLHDLAPNGELSSEFHLSYRGGVRVEIEVDVGLGLATLKPVKVTIVLAVLVKSISGMMTLKIKAPPTNRFWIGFQEAPEMDIVIEPIVADKAIKLNMVLSAIESKIREAMVEAIVLPNMDDTPFFDSHGTGGIFEGDEDISSETAEESDADSMMMGKSGRSGRRRSAGDRRDSVSSFNSEHAPPKLDGAERKLSWSSAGTESDIDPESVPLASTPPSSIYLQPNNSSSTSTVPTTNTTTPIAAAMAAKFKRFSQAHFPSKSTESLAEASKLNTRPTVATSTATAIRTSPAGTSHSVNSSNAGKLSSAIPKLNVISDASEPAGPRIFASSASNGPAKKESSSSLRRLASLESPASDDSESSTDSAENTATPTGKDPVYQSLQSPVESVDNKDDVPRQVRRTEFDTFPRLNVSRGSDTTYGQTDGNGKEATSNGVSGMTSSSSHVGIAGILEGKRSRTNSISGTAMTVQSNLANLFSSERRNKKNQTKGDNSGDSNTNNNNNNNNNGSNLSSNIEQDTVKTNYNNNGHTKDHGRRNSGDSLLSFKMKKDLLLKKITSNGSTNSNQSEEEHDGASIKSLSSKFSLDDIRAGGLLGHRRRGSLPGQNGKVGQKQTATDMSRLHSADHPQEYQEQQEQREFEQGSPQRQEPGRRGLERSMSSTAVSSPRDVDLYPLGKPFEGSSPSSRVSLTAQDESAANQPLSATVASSRTTPLTSLGSMGSTRSSSSTSSTSRYLQEKSQAALGATKAWMKRSLDERRMSEDDPLLSGKMRLD
jgi:hypothetical protein